MDILDVFVTPIGVVDSPTPLSKNQYDYILNTEYVYGSSHLISKDRDILNSPVLENLREWIMERVKEYYVNIMRTESEPYITQSWSNLIKARMYTHAHTHPNSIVSGVYYVLANDVIHFTQRRSQFNLKRLDYNHYNSDLYTVNVSKDRLILFPSHLEHSTPFSAEEIRLSIAFNTFVKGSLGSYDELTYLEMKNG